VVTKHLDEVRVQGAARRLAQPPGDRYRQALENLTSPESPSNGGRGGR